MKAIGLGDRMKFYEGRENSNRLMSQLPICARLDGRAFHTFTRHFERPHDEKFCRLMVETLKYLVAETNALIGYTQSDEISLIWYAEKEESEVFFDARQTKMTSVLASMATAFFNSKLKEFKPDVEGMPVFDARVWNVPSLDEAVNTLIWREQDAVRNSIQMAAQSMFSHNQLQNKNVKVLQEMMFQEKGVNWNNYPACQKRGTYVARRKVERPFTAEEIEKLPKKHAARTNPDLKIVRSEIFVMDLPILTKVINRVDVIFNGAVPVVASAEAVA
jgi:tRNA(His) guanylyltransferase